MGQDCTQLTDAVARLNCFDRAYGADEPSPEGPPEVPPDDMGKWAIETEQSPLDDSTGVFLWLESEEDLPGPYGQSGPFLFHLRCFEDTTSAIFYFNDHFMSSIQNSGRVEYRIDQGEPQTVNMVESTDNEALGLWRGRQAIPWIESLIGAERLIIRATPFNGGTYTATFDIRGLDAAIVPLRETCGW